MFFSNFYTAIALYFTEDKTHLIPGRPGDGTSGSSVESPTEFIPLQMEDDKKSGR